MTEETIPNEKEDIQEETEVEEPEASAAAEAAAEDSAPEVASDEPADAAEATETETETEEDAAPEPAQASAETDTAEPAEADAADDTEAASEAEGELSLEDLKPGMELTGRVKSIELYGAFVDVGVGKDALLHISQLGKPNVRNVEDIVKKGEEITVYVIKVDPSAGRIALSLEKPPENPLNQLKTGAVVTGEVVRIENFGVFVEIGAERPGMIHVSELATGYVKSPEDVVSIGDEVQAKIIKVNRKKRQIDLSIKALEEAQVREAAASVNEAEGDEDVPTAMELALRRALNESQDEGAAAAEDDKKQRNSRKKKEQLQDVLSRTLKKHGD
jgi:ribosomal protein S1